MNKFRAVNIYPSYGDRLAIIQWTTAPVLNDGEFYIYKRLDGGAEWELLNTTPVFGNTYIDKNFFAGTKMQQPMYRILCLVNSKEYISDDVSPFGKVTRKAFGIAQTIIRSMHRQARQDGIPVLYYPLIRNGKLSGALDDVTGQRVTAPCSATGDYGTMYAGGFYSPMLTYIRFLDSSSAVQVKTNDSLYDSNKRQTQFLAFPPVRSGDMVVNVATSDRWIVGDVVTSDMVKSIIPINYYAELGLLDRNHKFYKVPVPDNYFELLEEMQCHQI